MKTVRRITFALSAFVCVALASCGEQPPVAPPDAPEAQEPSGTVTIQYYEAPRLVVEAESGEIEAPMALFEDAEASGGQYAMAPEGPDHSEISIGGHVLCSFALPEAGEYVLWFRTRWSGECGDSLDVVLDLDELGPVQDATYERWHWARLQKPVQIAAGEHTLLIENREDGAAVDQILLTPDPDYRPTEIQASSEPSVLSQAL